MTGYESKKKAAIAKTIDEVNLVDHEPDGRMAAQKFIEAENKKVSERYGYVPKLHSSEWQDKLAQSAQEPVGRFAKFTDGIWREVTDGSAGQPLYTAPQQRPWVGLTEEDFSAINQSCFTKLQAATSAELILKEKNNG